MSLAEFNHLRINVCGCTKSVSPTASKPKWNKPLLYIALYNFYKLIEVQLVVQHILIVPIGNGPTMLNIFES
jgi:hypothetical protein